MLQKIKNFPYRLIVHELRDVRVVGFIVFGIIVLLVSWSTVGIIQTNYDLQKKIAQLEQQNKIAELETANLKLKNQYYTTNQYIELTARRQFGKAAAGETVYVVPKSTAMAKTVDMPIIPTVAEKTEEEKPFYQRNFEAWMKFLFNPSDRGD